MKNPCEANSFSLHKDELSFVAASDSCNGNSCVSFLKYEVVNNLREESFEVNALSYLISEIWKSFHTLLHNVIRYQNNQTS